MRSSALLALPLLFTGCAPGGVYSGTLVDGMTGQPREGIVLLAKAEGVPDMTCQVRESTTDATGAFKFENTCQGGTYALSTTDDTLLLADPPTIVGGETPAAPVKIESWRSPAGSGLYLLKDDALTPVRTFSDVAKETALKSDPPVAIRYPSKKPTGAVTTVAGEDHLLISGKNNIEKLQFVPLVADTGARNFAENVTISDHVYIGVKFNSDTEYEALPPAAADTAKVHDVTSGQQVVRYMNADAIPAGRYAVLGESDNRTYVIDFGESQAPPKAEEAVAAE